ncbi:hypothetical protein Q2941_22055 [Bradyrhizobium sp. UFLA05-153]
MRRTIIRLKTEETIPTNPRRIDVIAAIRDKLERDYGIRFVYADKTTGEGVVMKRGGERVPTGNQNAPRSLMI